MAVIKVFDANGVKELSCFDTLDNVAYMPLEEPIENEEIVESASDDSVDF